MNKKLAIIGTVGVPGKYGGYETLADHLVRQLGDKYEFTVYCSGKKYKGDARKKEYLGAKLVYLPLDANGVQSIPYDTWSIVHALFKSDVLLILGVAGAWILPFVRLFTKKRIIISIDGIEWKRDKWSKLAKWYLWWAEKIAVRYSHADISDNESIQDYTARRYQTLSHIIEYGADHTISVKPVQSDKEKYPFLNQPYAFKVCRIEPENNIHVVLEAFSKMPKYTLVMIGNWNNSDYGRQMKSDFGDYNNIILLDPIYDQRTLDLIRGNCFLYVHGHSAGGTNPSLVEAMYLGLPIMAFDVSYNRTTTENRALYFSNEEDLRKLVENTRIHQLREMGDVMKSIAHVRYTWSNIAHKYEYLIYKVCTQRGKISVVPDWINMAKENLIFEDLAHLAHPAAFYEKR